MSLRSESSSSQSMSTDGQLISSNQLENIVHHSFPYEHIDYAFGYGSGVFTQTIPCSASTVHSQASVKTASQPMIDVILATTQPREFHTANLHRNSDHYSGLSRLLGIETILKIQSWGPGLYFHPYSLVQLHLNDIQVQQSIKYAVVSMERVKQDLKEWDWLYVAGRMQKPIAPIHITNKFNNDEIWEYQQTYNLKYALSAALLLLPPLDRNLYPDSWMEYDAHQVYERIVGLSYAGDPRIAAGAEDPQKVKKLVHSDGNLYRLQCMYDEQINLLEKEGLLSRSGNSKVTAGQEKISLDVIEPHTRYSLWQRLPLRLQKSTKSMFDTFRHCDPYDKGRRGAAIYSATLLRESISHIVAPAARMQSFKGLITAGFGKSLKYAFAKLAKGPIFNKLK